MPVISWIFQINAHWLTKHAKQFSYSRNIHHAVVSNTITDAAKDEAENKTE